MTALAYCVGASGFSPSTGGKKEKEKTEVINNDNFNFLSKLRNYNKLLTKLR